MSGAAVVIIIGGGQQQNRLADGAEQDGDTIRVRIIQQPGESTASVLRRAANLLDGEPE